LKPHKIEGATSHRTMPDTVPQEIRGVEVHTLTELDTNGYAWTIGEFMPTDEEKRRILAGEPIKIYVFGRAWPLVFPMVGPIVFAEDGKHIAVPDPMNTPDAPRILY